MKISRSDTIKVTGKLPVSIRLSSIKKGSVVTAKVVERIGNRVAILNLEGVRLRAEFLNGVPSEKRIALVLTERGPSTLIFKRAGKGDILSSVKEMISFTIFEPDDLSRNEIIKISRYIKDGMQGIFALNRQILKIITGDKGRKGSIADILNRLFKLGISRENMIFFSYLHLGGRIINLEILFTFLSALGLNEAEILRDLNEKAKKEKGLIDKINSFSKEIESVLKKEDNGELFRELLNYLTDFAGSDAESFSFEIPYYDSDEFQSIDCIVSGDGLMVSIQLSFLGMLNILFRGDKTGLFVSIFCENENSKIELERNLKGLESRLELIDKNIILNIYTSEEALNKIIEINSTLLLNSTFDMRA